MSPPGIERRIGHEQAIRALALLLIVNTPMVLVMFALAGANLWISVLIATGTSLASVGMLAVVHRRMSVGLTDPLIRHHFGICTQCRYIVDGLGDEGVCPECGVRFTRESLKEQWLEIYPDLRRHDDVKVYDA